VRRFEEYLPKRSLGKEEGQVTLKLLNKRSTTHGVTTDMNNQPNEQKPPRKPQYILWN